MSKKRILGVIGLGHVGAHAAYALAVQGIADELILVDKNAQKLASEVQDLRDAAAYLPHRVTVRAGDFPDLGACDVIINSVGKIELLYQSHDRLTEMDYTVPAVRSYAQKIKDSGFDGVLINITNPCDIVTRELALLLGVAVAALAGVWLDGQQSALADKVIRLHVIAHSDSPEDQALKLRVRDRVLARAQEILEQSADMEQAEQALTAALPELTREARETLAAEGCAQPVQARLEPAEFPTKDYDGFSLPAGKYLALRVIIGQGAGQNWWCVVFPPLCTAAACQWQDAGRAAGLEEDDLSLMAEEDAGYELRFRSVELWEMLRQWLGK